jgi:predicted RecA/RadA family phage recombinase
MGVSAATVEPALVGVFDLTKVGSQAWAVGDKVYWDNTAEQTIKTASGNTLIGTAMDPVGSGEAPPASLWTMAVDLSPFFSERT